MIGAIEGFSVRVTGKEKHKHWKNTTHGLKKKRNTKKSNVKGYNFLCLMRLMFGVG
jgi:hypothetical protein